MTHLKNRLIFFCSVLTLIHAPTLSQAGWLDSASTFFQDCRALLVSRSSLPQTLFENLQSDRELQDSLYYVALGAEKLSNAEHFLEKLQNLTPIEKAQFLKLLPRTDEPTYTLIRLILGDEKEWFRFLEFDRNALKTHYRFVPRIERLIQPLTTLSLASPKTFERWARQVPSNYQSQNTPGYVKEKYLKRIYDLILKIHYPGARTFQAALAQGATPEEAYRKFIDGMNLIFQNPSRLNYSGDDVLHSVAILQKWLRDLPQPWNALQLTLFGSFPNGKADLIKSDIDLDVTVIGESPKQFHPELIAGLQERQASVLTAIRDSLSARTPHVNLSLSFGQLKDELTVPGIINTLAFRITAKNIDLIVYAGYDGNTPLIISLAPETNR